MVILDTNIVIDHLRRVTKSESYLEKVIKQQTGSGLSIISIQELYEGKSVEDLQKKQFLLSTISRLTIYPYTYEVAKQAGEIARMIKRPMDFADASIAATAMINDAELFTFNLKDFQAIKGLKLFKLPE